MAPLLRKLGIVLLVGLLALPAGGAWAGRRDEREISAREAAALVQQRSGGQVLGVELGEARGHRIYRVKVLTRRGHVRIVWVDAATGRILR